MCGIAGMLSFQAANIHQHQLQAMADQLVHRGPDGLGYWLHPSGQVGFSHRRLAIIDLSEQAGQPFQYLDRYTIVHNGEIYNYIELKKELQSMGYRFRTESDTEVIAAAYDQYGDQCVVHFDGMFAFAIWDEKEQQLFAARDRLGEKPFYHCVHNQVFHFASEMKAIWAVGVPREPDETMLLQYLATGTAKNPTDVSQTFYTSIRSLPPAHHLTVSKQGQAITKYWTPAATTPWEGDFSSAVDRFSELLTLSVSRRMRSDVHIGSCLSGGIDSATIVSKMLELGGLPTTFSAVFPGFERDESEYISELNSQFQTPNHLVSPTLYDCQQQLLNLMYNQEEPVSSMSVLAQWSVYEKAREQGVIVLLDGQGADELLAGYEKYLPWYWQELWSQRQFSQLREEKKAAADKGIPVSWGLNNWLAAIFPGMAANYLQRKKQRALSHLSNVNPDLLDSVRQNSIEAVAPLIITDLNRRLLADQLTGPLEELLRYADRNAMAHGVEVRLPFLQHELVEFLMSLPASFKVKKGYTKYLLRTMQQNRLPDAIVWRKRKVGFEPPQKKWMQEAAMQALVQDSKQWLINQRILKPEVLKQPIQPKSAYEPDNFDWRFVCMACFLQAGKNHT